ncbi:MAG: hypothetical protein ACXW2C_04305 [Acidimicrobiia bacterium]
MLGPVLIVITLVLAVPVGVMLGGMVWSAILSFLLIDDADQRAESQPS